jgi:ion channel
MKSRTIARDRRDMWSQLFAGGLVSFLNFGIHALMTGVIIEVTRRTAARTDHLHAFMRMIALLTVTMISLMCAHVVEIGVWAIYYHATDSMPSGIDAFHFAFENYTALGYGNPVPPEGKRLIGPITALNGLLLIGWSVAIIFEVMRMAQVQIGRLDERDES